MKIKELIDSIKAIIQEHEDGATTGFEMVNFIQKELLKVSNSSDWYIKEAISSMKDHLKKIEVTVPKEERE